MRSRFLGMFLAVSLVVFLAAGASALAAGGLTVSAIQSGGTVTISGNTAPSGSIAIQVDDPQGNVVFVGQAVSDGQGYFGDSFTLSAGAVTGTYTVYATAAPGGVSGNNTFMVRQVQAVTVTGVNSINPITVPYGTALANVGLPATVGITLSNGTTPTVNVTWNGGTPAYNGSVAGSYSFTGTLTLPSGVTNPNNLTASVVVTVQNASSNNNTGGGGTSTPAIAITTTSLAAGTVGQRYNQALSTNNEGTPPYTFTVTSGHLPAGLTLDASSGALGGTPTTAGTYTFTVTVKDANNQSASESYTLTVNAAPPQPVALKDIAGNWAQVDIARLVSLGAVTGYPDGTFRPDNDVTRAEFATILVKALKLPPTAGHIFADTEGSWAENYISTAAAYGIVKGYDAAHFGPNDLISREQMTAMVVRAARLAPVSGELTFMDAAKIDAWARGNVITAVKNGIVHGYPPSTSGGYPTFRPLNHATRAEAVTVIMGILK